MSMEWNFILLSKEVACFENVKISGKVHVFLWKRLIGNDFYQTIFTKGLVTIFHYSLWLSLRFYYASCLIDHNLSHFFDWNALQRG